MSEPKWVPIIVRLSPEMHVQLAEFARETDRSRAATIRRALREFMAREGVQ